MTPDEPRGVRRLFRLPSTRASVAHEVDAEIHFHIEQRVADLVARGLSPAAARAQADREYGSVAESRTELTAVARRRLRRDRRRGWLDTVRQDARYAARALRRQPLHAALALLCIALGVGATTTVFSVANTLLVRPLPFPNGDRLVSVGSVRAGDARLGPTSIPDFVEWQARQRVFTHLGAVARENFIVAGDVPNATERTRVYGARVTAGLFPALGVRPKRGRLLVAADNLPGAAHVALVSEGLAARLFGGGEALGRGVQVGGEAYTVVGVLPVEGVYPDAAELWTPLVPDPALQVPSAPQGRGIRFLDVVAALRPEVSLERAGADMRAVARGIAREHPEQNADVGARVEPLRERYVGQARPTFLAMSCAAVLLFLIACANVASLQLARASARAREVAVRAALGATRRRVVAQLLAEHMLLAVVGGLLGVGIAVGAGRFLAQAVVGTLPAWMTFRPDVAVLAFTLAVSTVAGLLVGLAPARGLARTSAASTLRGSRAGLDLARGRLYRGLVGAELALSLVLLTGAALAAQSFVRLRRLDPGIVPRGVVTFSLSMQGPRYAQNAAVVRTVAEVLERVRAIPGVQAAAATSHVPPMRCCSSTGFAIEGRPVEPGKEPEAGFTVVSPEYFRALGIRRLRGREFTPADGDGAQRVTIVNEAMARTYWPGEDAVGKRILRGTGPITIVGVVGDVRSYALGDPVGPQLYMPHAQDPWSDMSFAVRTTLADPAALAPAIRRAVRGVDPALVAFDVATLDRRLARAVAPQRLYGALFAGFALTALALATAGVYGVTAHYVARRTREIGIRVALGAARADVLRLVVGQTARVAALGLAVGVLGAWLGGRALAHLLYGVAAGDPLVLGGPALLLAAAALLAALVPARRASAIEPLRTMRDGE